MRWLFRQVTNYIRQTDRWLWGGCLAMSALSVLLLLGLRHSGLATGRQVATQAAASALGVIAVVVLSKLDYRWMAELYRLYVPVALFLMVLTYFFGVQRMEGVDDKAWLLVPVIGLSFQPAELLKIAFILFFARELERTPGVNAPKNLLRLCLIGAVPTLMIMLQGDDGTALVMLLIFAVMLFSAGLSYKYVAAAGAAAVVAAPLVWNYYLDYDKKMRILCAYDHTIDPRGIGWQQYTSRLSIGSGQVWGVGLFADSHAYVPEMHNDFIFSFVGQALGFVGAVAVVFLFCLICGRLLAAGRTARDPLGRTICIGVFAMILIQVVINIGMNLSLLPVVGITLPLLSAGGTSVTVTYLAIGLAQSVHMHTREGMFLEK